MPPSNYVRPGFFPASYPNEAWDGLTPSRIEPEAVVSPNGYDFEKVIVEVIAVQDALRALINRTNNNNIQLVNPVWCDLKQDVNSLRIPDTNGPTWVTYKSTELLAFSDQAVNEERVHFAIRLPNDYKIGSNIRPHIHWIGEDGTAGNVYWKLTYNIAPIGVEFGANLTLAAASENNGADVHNYSEIGVIDMSSFSDTHQSIMLLGELRRNSGNALDTLNGKDAYLVEFGFSYQSDVLGSPSLEFISTVLKQFGVTFSSSGTVSADLLDIFFFDAAITSSSTVTAKLDIDKPLSADIDASGEMIADVTKV